MSIFYAKKYYSIIINKLASPLEGSNYSNSPKRKTCRRYLFIFYSIYNFAQKIALPY